MKSRPILFRGEMVRAILAGTKTQTRRAVKYIPALGEPEDWCQQAHTASFSRIVGDYRNFCPHGTAGDQLWVKETWRAHENHDALRPRLVVSAMGGDYRGCVDYLATPGLEPFWGKTRVSIFMPPEFSRIKLAITDVRVERLNAISEADAKAEGVRMEEGGYWNYIAGEPYQGMTAQQSFETLWDHVHGSGAWERDSSKWLWVISFQRVSP